MINRGLFSSATCEWATPQWLFNNLNREFHFTCDVCATAENAKCAKYYTKETDGRFQDRSKDMNWCNPPYGRLIKDWISKASHENCVMLLPARTDTRWFHDFIHGRAEIRFIRGRLKFGVSANSAPFPSMIVIFRKGDKRK